MDVILLGLIGGVAALLLLAAGVAGWEQLRRSVRPQDEFTSATPRAVNVDVRLDRLGPQSAPATSAAAQPAGTDIPGDLLQRRAALDQVLARLAQPAGITPDNPLNWADTTPMVGPGQLKPQDDSGAVGEQPREFSPSQ